ncbi:MAG: transketolase [Clostridium sp.]
MITDDLLKKCEVATKIMRKRCLDMTFSTGNNGAHIGGALSIIEILATLYLGVIDPNKIACNSEYRDRFILSKGHGALALYAALSCVGLIEESELDTYKSNNTYLYGHPSINLEKGIEFSSGSLGQGLSLGVGTCLSLYFKKNNSSKVFVLLGDGECDEGSIWEAASSASHFNTKNLTAIVDKNGLQYDGYTKDVMDKGEMERRWSAFGWHTIEIDGHDISQLYNAFMLETEKPKVIIANTIKGKGISFMENNPLWHHSRITQQQYDDAIFELEVN